MRGHRTTGPIAARDAAIACLAAAVLLAPGAAPARTAPDAPAAQGRATGRATPDQATRGQSAPQLGLTLHSTGAVAAQLALEVPADPAHRCASPEAPGGAYQLSFGKPPGVALLDPAYPGLAISVAGRPDTAAARVAGGTGTAGPDQAGRQGAGDAAGPGADAPGESSIQLSVGGRRFIGIGSMDPEYHLSVTLSADGQRGSFTARHLVDASGSGAVDASGTWRCPASGAEPVDDQARGIQDPGSPAPEALAATIPLVGAGPGAAGGDAAAPDPPAGPEPSASDSPVPPDPSTRDAGTAAAPPASATSPPGTVPGPAKAAAAGPLGSATALLVPPRHHGRTSRQVAAKGPGCTSTATLDGVSAALQAGPFGRRQNLSIMQFRNVVTDDALDGQVACHADVVLSDDSLHRAEYSLRSVGRRTRVHIEVARDREGTAAIGGQAPPGRSEADPPQGRPEAPSPAT